VCYARYVGLGMRYEAGICAIVISLNINGHLNHSIFAIGFNVYKNMDYILGIGTIKAIFRTSPEMSFHADRSAASCLIQMKRYILHLPLDMG